jgi:hypothetical protein
VRICFSWQQILFLPYKLRNHALNINKIAQLLANAESPDQGLIIARIIEIFLLKGGSLNEAKLSGFTFPLTPAQCNLRIPLFIQNY